MICFTSFFILKGINIYLLFHIKIISFIKRDYYIFDTFFLLISFIKRDNYIFDTFIFCGMKYSDVVCIIYQSPHVLTALLQLDLIKTLSSKSRYL